jgi:hypothetical protein
MRADEEPTFVFVFRGAKRVNLNSAVDLTTKNARISKKDSYEWIA